MVRFQLAAIGLFNVVYNRTIAERERVAQEICSQPGPLTYVCSPLGVPRVAATPGWLRGLAQRATGVGDPVVLVACGSFSPITYLHLRMFGTTQGANTHNVMPARSD